MLRGLVVAKIAKTDTQFRQCISSGCRLMVTLRFLVTRELFKNLAFNTRISLAAISKFVPEVLRAIYEELQQTFLKVPSTAQEWLEVAKAFDDNWNVPNTVDCIDGKHIAFQAPQVPIIIIIKVTTA
ncbi:hypothetical protein ILUMI_13025 [Ignelater luminosus]|uniref:Uncharacterized protein n=1 Tax=Ignelater luminosus TaxID=2038154 RepID=A0A8K0CT38_IGNLU|nr:hypothetical protein ILUMI_13025 [Ignelater luminosus]